MFTRYTAALAALLFVSAAPFAQAADKPTDPQIAHIAYTAGVLDIEAAKLAIKTSKAMTSLFFDVLIASLAASMSRTPAV